MIQFEILIPFFMWYDCCRGSPMPTIKASGTVRAQNNFFYLFGEKETGLTKAFAYVLGENKSLLFSFLKEIGLGIRQSDSNFRAIEITTEKNHEEVGRTDIEIKSKNIFHVIVEAKIGSNKVVKQNTQYLPVFDDVPQRIMCFISQENAHLAPNTHGISVKNINWVFIDRLIDEQRFLEDPIIRNFQLYLRRYFITMKAQKEILIQDLSKAQELQYLQTRRCGLRFSAVFRSLFQ